MSADVDAERGVDQTAASDAELIARASEGDARALETLYDRYARVVYSFALRIVGDPQVAEELMQEVFFRAWQQGRAFRSSRGSFITWLLSITHNLSIDELRKRRRRPQRAENNHEEDQPLLSDMPDESQNIEEEVWLTTLRERIAKALETLPPAQREAIELAYFQGLTQREVAERLGEPLGTIKTRMRLGMQKLREQLGDELGELVERAEDEVDERE
ncbi:MAG TPA: sigma-70 family RNA polymerase sigma factor [Thermomicrobiales bacterium]